LAEMIQNAAEKKIVLSEMGAAARKLAQERANWNINFVHLLEAYEMAIRNVFDPVPHTSEASNPWTGKR
jgi:hypothetical protein